MKLSCLVHHCFTSCKSVYVARLLTVCSGIVQPSTLESTARTDQAKLHHWSSRQGQTAHDLINVLGLMVFSFSLLNGNCRGEHRGASLGMWWWALILCPHNGPNLDSNSLAAVGGPTGIQEIFFAPS